MLALLISSLLLLFLMLGFGHFAIKSTGLQADWWDTLFLGLAALNTLCAWTSLFVPTGFRLLLALLAVCGLLVFLYRRDIASSWKAAGHSGAARTSTMVFFAIGLMVASNAPLNSDTPLYHLPTIKWYEQYPVVPGLANLHARFSVNQNVFLVFSLTSLKDVFGQEVFCVNLLVVAVFMGYLFGRLQAVHALQGLTPLWLFYLLMGVSAIRLTNLSSPTPDVLSQVLPMYVFLRVLDMRMEGDRPSYAGMPVMFLLFCYAATVKLSAAPLILLFLAMLLTGTGPGLMGYLRLTPWMFLVVAPWLARNVVMSGWLVFPFPSLDLFTFDWKVPYQQVFDFKVSVTGWARVPKLDGYVQAYHMGFSEWFPLWLSNGKHSTLQFILILLGFLFPAAGILWMALRRTARDPVVFSILMACLGGMIFWFWSAPTYRFGAGFISTSSAVFLLLLGPVELRLPWQSSNALVGRVAALLIVYMMFVNMATLTDVFTGRFITTGRWYRPDLMDIGHVRFKALQGRNFTMYHPVDTDLCYDFKLPCTPYPDSTLTMRGATLGEGFRKAVR